LEERDDVPVISRLAGRALATWVTAKATTAEARTEYFMIYRNEGGGG
jgi:hypothetical protein